MKHQTAVFVLEEERVAYYNYRHRRGYTGPIISNRVSGRRENNIMNLIAKKHCKTSASRLLDHPYGPAASFVPLFNILLLFFKVLMKILCFNDLKLVSSKN
jgi:hypothetical protein